MLCQTSPAQMIEPTRMQAWNSGLYQYLSGEVHLGKGDSFANPSTLNLHANDTLPGSKPGPHGPSESFFDILLRCIYRQVLRALRHPRYLG